MPSIGITEAASLILLIVQKIQAAIAANKTTIEFNVEDLGERFSTVNAEIQADDPTDTPSGG